MSLPISPEDSGDDHEAKSEGAEPAETPGGAHAEAKPEARGEAPEVVKLKASDVVRLKVENGQLAAEKAALAKQVADLERERAELRDAALRVRADMENLRKRSEREKIEIGKYAISDFAREVLGIGDNIRRAIEHVPAGEAERDGTLKSVLEGMQLLEREIDQSLERHGVVRLSPEGQRFDPHQHQAMMEQENPDVPSGTVVQVLQIGYMIGERVLRPAFVVVSRGGAKIPKPAATAPSEEAGQPAAANDDEVEGTGEAGPDPSRDSEP